eukprot:608288-Pelagomonas_calceolata.AAC.1
MPSIGGSQWEALSLMHASEWQAGMAKTGGSRGSQWASGMACLRRWNQSLLALPNASHEPG